MREKEKQKGGFEGIYDLMGDIKVWEKRGKGIVGELEKDSMGEYERRKDRIGKQALWDNESQS